VATTSKRQVLVVDDDPSVRECVARSLESAGYLVASAEDGFRALVQMKKTLPDVIVSDLNMPGMSGFELLALVRRSFPQILTVAMSGAYRDRSELPPNLIADGYYPKGEHPEILFGTLAQLFLAAPARSA
jgi:CheY-like chemotaxis protein